MKNGGRIPLSVIAICDTFKISGMMGRHPMKGHSKYHFHGSVVPFGAMVEYLTLSLLKTCRDCISSAQKSCQVYFLDMHCTREESGMETQWSQAFEGLEDASELHARRLNAKEVLTPLSGEKFIFPVADGTVKLSGENTHLNPGSPRPRRRESNLPRESDGSSSTPLRDSSWYGGDAWNFRKFTYRHHVEPRVKLYVPREESFLIPLKDIDVTRTADTSLDVMLEKNVDDYWSIEGDRDPSDSWTGFTRFTILDEKVPDGYTWSGKWLTKKQTTSRPE